MKRIFGFIRGHKKLTVILGVIAIAAFLILRMQNGNESFEEAKVERGSVAEEMILPGAVVADEHAKLSFPTSGRLTWINVAEGQEVAKGLALAAIDTTELNSALQRARADLRAAEANLAAVYDSLQNKGSSETFEERSIRTAAEVTKDKAYEAVVAAQRNLRDATLTSPFSGLVTFVATPFTGVNVVATQTLIEIINPETIHFEVAADQSEVIEINKGDVVNIILDATDEEIAGTVETVSYTTIPGEVGSVYSVKIIFNNELSENTLYRVGMTADAHFVLNKKDNVLYVPTDFVKSDSEGDYVLTNGGKDKTYVEIGLEGEERTEILSGIEEGVLIYD